jgi:type IV pilus assembly protein PilA
MKKNKGFTLVEIMIVVVIIGLLAAMAVPAFQQVRKSSSEKAALNDLRQIAAAADQYFLDNGATQVTVTTSLVPTYVKALTTTNTYPGSVTSTMTSIVATTPFGTVQYKM